MCERKVDGPAGTGSEPARRHHLYIDDVGVASVPYDYESRLTDFCPETFELDFLDECIGLIWSDRVNLRTLWVCCCRCSRRLSRTERAAVGAVFSDD
jgi:hypothetical protein